MGLVKGFTDIIAPQNLAFNGGFLVDQRGTHGSATLALAQQYIGDCWHIGSTPTVDSLKAAFQPIYGRVYFAGYGKKGQTFNFVNKADTSFRTTVVNGTNYRTAAVDIRNSPGMIPIKVDVLPRYNSEYATLYTNPFLATTVKSTGTAVRAIANHRYNTENAAYITVTLMADGAFNFDLCNYRELAGAFVNPPPAPVSYADDLLRCKRYYQSGTAFSWSLGRNSGVNFVASAMVQLAPEMAGTPTVVMSEATVTEVGSTVDVASNYITLSPVSVHNKGFLGTFYKTPTGALPNSFTFVWTATV